MKKPLPGQKSKKRYRLLKPSRLAPALLLAAGILCCFAALPGLGQRSGVGNSIARGGGAGCGSSPFNGAGAGNDNGNDNSKNPAVFLDIANFRRARMALPERLASCFPLATSKAAQPGNETLGINAHEGPGSLLAKYQQFLAYREDTFVIPGKLFIRGPLPNEYRLIQRRDFDFNGDGFPERCTLRNGKVIVQADSRRIWQSPDDWWVDYFSLGDADNDGAPELCLLLWKEGSFGPYKPFWLEKNDCSVKNHLFIYRMENDAFKPVWQSSNLDCPNYFAALIDVNGNGENALLVVEGSYTNPEKKELTRWQWNGWGFSRVD